MAAAKASKEATSVLAATRKSRRPGVAEYVACSSDMRQPVHVIVAALPITRGIHGNRPHGQSAREAVSSLINDAIIIPSTDNGISADSPWGAT
jgi:hypothetical protein